MSTLEQDLDALLKEARTQANAKRQKPGQPTPAAARLAWTDPKRWTIMGHVQLVHSEKGVEGAIQTLVGLFEERIHSSGARHLVAVQLDPTMTPRVEYVSGEHWITDYTLELKRRQPDHQIEVCEDLVLDCGPASPAAVVSCRIVGGGVARVILTADTRFESHTPRTILCLPAGMDVLEGLTRDTKERIWAEVQRQLGVTDLDEGV